MLPLYSRSCINAQMCIITLKLHLSRVLCVCVCLWGNHSCICMCVCVWYMVISHRRGFYCVIISAVTLTSFGCRSTADQLHWRTRPLAYYTQIISGFYPPCYSSYYTHEHLIFAGRAWAECCIYVHIISVLLSVMLCCLYWGAPACWFITPAFCCLSSLLDCIFGAPICHLCMCQLVARFGMRDLWLEGDLQTGDLWGRRRWGEKEGSKSLCIQWLGYSRQHCQHFPQRVAENQGGW